MDFYDKYKLFKKNKKKKHEIKDYINNKNIFFGSGGSDNIIVIINDQEVAKIIPNFNKEPNMKNIQDNDIKEIEFYKFFLNKFIKPNITPHIVGYYTNYKLVNITSIFPKKCASIDEKLLINPNKMNYVDDRLCELKTLYKFNVIKKTADVIILENCGSTIESSIRSILNLKKFRYEMLEHFINRSIFQLIYTLTAIQNMYPTFIHNDLFLRNILGKYENDYNENEYVEYKYKGKSYYMEANGFYLKINDFGYSLMPPIIASKTLYEKIEFNPTMGMTYDDKLKDVFTFLYDYYDGENLGHSSVMELLTTNKENENVKKRFRNIFKKYIDVDMIDKISKRNKPLLDRQWNIKYVPLLRKTIMEPKMYFIKGSFDKYKTIPRNSKIVRTFEIE